MNERLNNLLETVFQYVVLITALVIPLFFWNLTSEYYEIPKFIFLFSTVGLLLILWVTRWILTGKVVITRTKLDLPFLMLLIVFSISTFFSESRPVSIFGNFPRLHGGLITFTTYIVLYFALVSNLKKVSVAKKLINTLFVSGIILSVISLLSYFGIRVFPWDWTSAQSFTPTGLGFSTTAILALLLPFPLTALLYDTDKKGKPRLDSPIEEIAGMISPVGSKSSRKEVSINKLVRNIIFASVITLFVVTIVLTGSFITMAAAALAYVLILAFTSKATIKRNLPFIFSPLLLGIAIYLLSILPLGGNVNFFHTQAQKMPREIQLSAQASWKVSVSAFRDAPFWGTGPSTFLFDFTNYKPAEVNLTQFWNIRFDQAFNEYFYFLATVGALGLMALILLTVIFISSAIKILKSPEGSVGMSLAVSGIVFFLILALHSSTLPVWVVGILILASFMVVHKSLTQQVHLGISGEGTNRQRSELHFDALPIIFSLLILIPLGVAIFFAGKYTLADIYHRKALNQVLAGNALNAYKELVKSEQLNPYIDLYRVDLAQTNFALANAVAAAKVSKGSTESAQLSDKDKQDIQTLISQSINEGKTAVALSPNNASNWEVLGSIYREIAGVAQNALAFSLDSYGRAIQKDPLNPLLRLTVGGVYYQAKNYDMAIRFFSDAVSLKPDYANGYFNLAMALKEKGDTQNAIAYAEKTLSLLDKNNPDYKTASELLDSLKAQASQQQPEQPKAPTKDVEPSTTQAKSKTKLKSATSSALQDESLPKVVDLSPDKSTTPAATKKTSK